MSDRAIARVAGHGHAVQLEVTLSTRLKASGVNHPNDLPQGTELRLAGVLRFEVGNPDRDR